MASLRKLLVIGLPEAGKSTFIAALYHVAESGEVKGSLKLKRISSDAKHLNALRREWLKFEHATRTIPDAEQSVSMLLEEPDAHSIGEIVFPDLSGETFNEDQWRDRHWSPEYEALVNEADSILLFVHIGMVREPYTIADIQKIAQAALPEETDVQYRSESISADSKEAKAKTEAASTIEGWAKESQETDSIHWSADLVCTQVKLVGLLQFLVPYVEKRAPIRVGVLLSAWDLEKVTEKGVRVDPYVWLSKRLPYLHQFLRAHEAIFSTQVYGVSAQGGDLEKDQDKLAECEPASERIIIQGAQCAAHDITEPVRWALGLREPA